MSSLKSTLLTSCCTLGVENTDGGSSEVTADCTEVSSAPVASPDVPLSPSAPGRTPNSPRAPPWGATPAAVAPIQPIAVPPLTAAMLIGGSRSTVYRLLAAGKLRAVKRGGATLVLTNSIYDYMASLPPATFGRRQQNAAA
jgi:excisionase family DNA binding protein